MANTSTGSLGGGYGGGDLPVSGWRMLYHPKLNKGMAFTRAERDRLNLRGLLPPAELTIDRQVTLELEHLRAKNTDIIVGNTIGEEGSGFSCDTNKVTLFYRDGTREKLPSMTKIDVAHKVLDRVLERVVHVNPIPGA